VSNDSGFDRRGSGPIAARRTRPAADSTLATGAPQPMPRVKSAFDVSQADYTRSLVLSANPNMPRNRSDTSINSGVSATSGDLFKGERNKPDVLSRRHTVMERTGENGINQHQQPPPPVAARRTAATTSVESASDKSSVMAVPPSRGVVQYSHSVSEVKKPPAVAVKKVPPPLPLTRPVAVATEVSRPMAAPRPASNAVVGREGSPPRRPADAPVRAPSNVPPQRPTAGPVAVRPFVGTEKTVEDGKLSTSSGVVEGSTGSAVPPQRAPPPAVRSRTSVLVHQAAVVQQDVDGDN